MLKHKIPYSILFFLFLLLLSGCVGDSMKDCPVIEADDNTTLFFKYDGFLQHIEKVDMGIFDSEGRFVLGKTVDKQMLGKAQAISMHLVPGTYTVVCWGNALENTTIEGFTEGYSFGQGKIFHPNYPLGQAIPKNDSLYYGRQEFTKEKNIDKSETVLFEPAHVKMKIAVIGLSNMEPGTLSADYPVIRINNLEAISDFEKNISGGPVSYYPDINVDTRNKIGVVYCNVLRFIDDNSITIDVVRSTKDSELLYRIRLKEFMQANNIHIVDGQEAQISMKITFTGGNIAVSLGGWGNNPVTPGL